LRIQKLLHALYDRIVGPELIRNVLDVPEIVIMRGVRIVKLIDPLRERILGEREPEYDVEGYFVLYGPRGGSLRIGGFVSENVC
jgi:hypothetical protein